MFRYKAVIGRGLRARTLPAQKTEARVGCAVLNRGVSSADEVLRNAQFALKRAKRIGTTQVYEKDGDSLQVQLWEGLWYTYAEYTTGRVMKRVK